MVILFIFIIMVYGLSNMMVYSEGPFHLFDFYRKVMSKMPSNLGEGANCMICTPCQVGIVLSLLNLFLFPSITFTPCNMIMHNEYSNLWFIIAIMDGAIGSGSTWLIHTIQEWFEHNGGE